jgi:hypothetical protein
VVTDAENTADWERCCLDQIVYYQRNIGELNAIREEYPEDWEIQELSRAIIHDEAQIIDLLRKEIENARKSLKKLG